MHNRIRNLNIDVYVKNAVLFARFDILSNSQDMIDKISLLENIGHVAEKFSNKPMYIEDFRNDSTQIRDKKIIQHILQIQPKEPNGLNSLKGESATNTIMSHNKTEKPISHMNITYRISSIPNVMINWIACLAVFMSQKGKYIPEHIQFSDHSQFEKINTHPEIMNLLAQNTSVCILMEKIHTFLFSQKNCKNTFVRTMMEKILEFQTFQPNLEHYQEAFTDLKKFYNSYAVNCKLAAPKTLVQCLSDQIRCDLMYGNQFSELSKPEKNIQQKELYILSLAETMISKKHEFLFMLDLMNSKNKISFIEPCMGKIAHDNEPYQMAHTELMLIYFAEFHLFPDGKMGIINLDKNPAYLQYYAEGKDNYNLLNDEVKHLANCLNLQLEPNCDFHQDKKIIFRADCSLKLASLDLHLNANYSKTLFNVYNTWAFYSRMHWAGNNKFSLLADEILDDILLKANPPFQRIYSDKSHLGFFHAVHLGRERGKKEHHEVDKRNLLKKSI